MRAIRWISGMTVVLALMVQPMIAGANNSPPCPSSIDVVSKTVPSGFVKMDKGASFVATTGAECAYSISTTMEFLLADTNTVPRPTCTTTAQTATCTWSATGVVKTYTCPTRVDLDVVTAPPAGMTEQQASLAFDKVDNHLHASGGTHSIQCFYKNKTFTAFK